MSNYHHNRCPHCSSALKVVDTRWVPSKNHRRRRYRCAAGCSEPFTTIELRPEAFETMQAKAEAWDLTRAGLAELMDIAHKQFGGDGNAEAVVLRGRGYIVTDVDKIGDQRIINALRNLCPECGAAPGDHCVAIKVAERKVGKGSFCHGGREL